MITLMIFDFLQNLRGLEWVIIIVVFLLLFGAKRIPNMMRSIGKGVRGFKQGLNDMKDEINKPLDEDNEQKGKEDNK